MSKKITGELILTRRGIGYIRDNDVEIAPEDISNAFPDDIVEVEIISKGKGKIAKVLERAQTQFVGTVIEEDGKTFISPDNKKVGRNIYIHKADTKDLKLNKKVLVEITFWGDEKKLPEAKVLRVIGTKGEHETEIQAILLDQGFDTSFPQEVEKEALKLAEDQSVISASEIATRKDFRQTTTFTIDPVDAKDFDDAISIEERGDDLFEIGVHIADVSHYVREGTLLDEEARERGFSVYLVDRTIPMLPEVLSNGLSSLNPNEDKLTFSAIFLMDGSGNIKDRWFGKTIINSDKRFTYEEAQESITGAENLYHKELTVLNSIAKKLRERRFKEGAIDFESDEFRFELDKDGKPIRIVRKERFDAHKLVEEFMLLANREVGEFMYKKLRRRGGKKPFIYRIHAKPDQEKMEQLSIFLRALGYEFNVDMEKLSSKDIHAMLKKIEGRAEESLIKTAAVRSMAKAIYSTKNIGHFGLAFQYYTHFTSPIRRYPDLIVHRLLHKELQGKVVADQEFSLYYKIAEEASDKEISAAEAERESKKYKQTEYMTGHIGETFEGIISGVTDWGIYVEEKNTGAEGLVHVRDLGDDYWNLDQKSYALVGEKTKKRYSLGDVITFTVSEADLEQKRLSYKLAEM